MDGSLGHQGRVKGELSRRPPGRRIIVVGARRDARRLLRHMDTGRYQGLPIIGFVDAGHVGESGPRPRSKHLALHPQSAPVPVLGGLDRLGELVDRTRATHVVVALSKAPHSKLRPKVAHLSGSQVSIHWISVDQTKPDLRALELDDGQGPGDSGARPESLDWIVSLVSGGVAPARLAKRACDALFAGLGLLILSPLFATVAITILVSSGRPIFYRQERIGRGGRLFRIIKFRSMRSDAESQTGPIWASDHDARCTTIGGWLRHTNIDELPQLINVLRGEMSLVGPRPERPMFVEQFRQDMPDYDLRHAVPCGMTGWAQVHGWRGRTSLRKRVQYDLDYIRRWSFWLDFRIMLMTIQHVLWGKTSWNLSRNARKPGP